MSLMQSIKIKLTALAIVSVFATGLLIPKTADAHCDRVNGPVAKAARKALKNNNFKTVQIWVGKKQEDELRSAFKRCRKVYQKQGASRKLARRYFMETTVRLHRAAEGMPYTGLKPAHPLPKDLKVAENALTTENADEVTRLLKNEIEQNVNKWHRKAVQAKANKDESVKSGRKWVDAYVKYVIYVHKLYQKIQAGPPHGVGQ